MLILCAQLQPTPVQIDRIRQLTAHNDLEWDRLLRLVKRHRLVGLVYRNLSRALDTDFASVPAEVLEELRTVYNLSAGRNLYLAGALMRLLKYFERNGIPVIPFKGPTLAQSLYGNLSMREFGDLDILVRRDDLERVKRALAELHYVPQDELNAEQEAEHYREKYNRVYRSDDGRLVLEVHWSLAYEYFASIDDPHLFWDHAETHHVLNHDILMPPAEDLLLYLLGHGYRHMWERLSWIVDVAALLQAHPSIDWGYVVTTAARLRINRVMLLGLFLAHDLLALPLPPELLRQIERSQAVLRSAEQIYEVLFEPEEPDAPNVEAFVFHLKLREHWLDKLAYVRMIAAEKLPPNEHDHALLALPPYLAFVYYLVRPVRLLRERGAAWLAALRRQLV